MAPLCQARACVAECAMATPLGRSSAARVPLTQRPAIARAPRSGRGAALRTQAVASPVKPAAPAAKKGEVISAEEAKVLYRDMVRRAGKPFRRPGRGQAAGAIVIHAFWRTRESAPRHLALQILGREFEEMCAQMYYRGKMFGFVHLYSGQEAVSTGRGRVGRQPLPAAAAAAAAMAADALLA